MAKKKHYYVGTFFDNDDISVASYAGRADGNEYYGPFTDKSKANKLKTVLIQKAKKDTAFLKKEGFKPNAVKGAVWVEATQTPAEFISNTEDDEEDW